MKRLLAVLVVLLVGAGLAGASNVGLRLLKAPHEAVPGGALTALVWYPTKASPKAYTYPVRRGIATQVAFNAPLEPEEGGRPLVLLSHGFGGSAAGLAYLGEALAAQGFIAAGVDHFDSVQMERSDGSAKPTLADIRDELVGARALSDSLRYPAQMPDLFDRRVPEAKALIDYLLALNTTEKGWLAGGIDSERIAAGGHSYGAYTTFVLCGGLGPKYADSRVKAGLCLSSPFWGEGTWEPRTLTQMKLPMYFFYGQFEAGGGPPSRADNLRWIFDHLPGPKYLAELAGATHGTFGGSAIAPWGSIQKALTGDAKLQTIVTTSLAFFKCYLMYDEAAGQRLLAGSPLFRVFDAQPTSELIAGVKPGMDEVLLFCYFRTSAEALHLAWSEDLYHWQPLKNNEPIYRTPYAISTIRDPFIRRGPDGWFYFIHTGGWTGKSFEWTRSRDLVNWEQARIVPIMESVPGCQNVWAPEAIWDEVGKVWVVYWSSITEGSPDQKLWHATTPDFEHFSRPEVLFYPGYSLIDGTLETDGARWYCLYKDERGENRKGTDNKGMRVAVSDSLHGPYEPVGNLVTAPLTEGPALFQWGEKWYLAYDHFMEERYSFSVSDNLLDWEELEGVEFPPGPRHGTFFYVTREELAAAKTALGEHR